MLPINRDGTFGPIEDFNLERMTDFLKNPKVDHVRVFDKEKGIKVKLTQAEQEEFDQKIDVLIEQKVNLYHERKKLAATQNEFEHLAQRFDKEVLKRNIIQK
jgi:hypothetical protein